MTSQNGSIYAMWKGDETVIVLIGLLIGLVIGLFANITIPADLIPYLAISTLVGIEALTASYSALQRDEFSPLKFVIEFIANLVIAGLLTALGVQLKYDFSLVIAFVFAYRIFRNIGFISRQFYFKLSAWNQARRKSTDANKEQKA